MLRDSNDVLVLEVLVMKHEVKHCIRMCVTFKTMLCTNCKAAPIAGLSAAPTIFGLGVLMTVGVAVSCLFARRMQCIETGVLQSAYSCWPFCQGPTCCEHLQGVHIVWWCCSRICVKMVHEGPVLQPLRQQYAALIPLALSQ